MAAMIAGLVLLAALLWAGTISLALVRALVARELVRPNLEVQLLLGALIFSCTMLVVVEFSSLLGVISRWGLAVGWIFAGAGLGMLRGKILQSAAAAGERDTTAATGRWANFTPEERFLAFGTGLVIFLLFLLAVFTPPTSWDSMTYHLPRVLNWIQNESVAPYVTSDTRQVESGPLAAYAVLQLYLVTGNDRLVNLVQWSAMLLSLAAVSWLAGEIARWINQKNESANLAPRKVKLWSIFLAATLPAGIVQAISTQTDYVVAFWFVAAVVFGWLLVLNPRNLVYAAAFGGAIGLGVLAKATMAAIAGLTAVVLFIWALKGAGSLGSRAKLAGVTGLVMIAIVTPHFARNFQLFGSPLGSRYIHALMRNPVRTPGAWWSNFVRNLSLHAASGFAPLTSGVNSLLRSAHVLSGRDQNDRATTFHTSTFSYPASYAVNDNQAGNFWHALLFLAGLILILVRLPAARAPALLIFLILLASFALLSGYLRWTEWNGRFHLGFFLLAAPLAGIAFASLLPRIGKLAVGLIAGVVALHATFYNESRPVLGQSEFLFQEREQQYFLQVPYLYEPMRQVASDIIASDCEVIGLRIYKDFFKFLDEMEYPLWIMLQNRGFAGTIHNVGVTNETARLAGPVTLQALISSARGPDDELTSALPYKTSYPPLKIYWSERASRWAQLSQVHADASQQIIATNQGIIDFDASAAVLLCRAPRQGILRFEGGFAQGESLLPGPTAMSVESYAGFAYTARSSNNLHLVELPLPAGQTAIHLRNLATNQPGAFFSLSYWRWFATDQPLPYIYVTKLYAPAPQSTNSMSLDPGATRTLELFSGAQGVVDVQFRSKNPVPGQFELAGNEVRTNVNFNGGLATARVPIARGTNSFQLATPANQPALQLENITLRFRAFVD